MWQGIIEAYNKTLDGVFRFLDWLKGRPKARMEDKRKMWEARSREAQIKGDLHGMQEARAEIQEIDRRMAIGDYDK
jgi:hypothetical protein